MTIGGAIAELQSLIKADDVPFYYKGGIEKVIETIQMDIPKQADDLISRADAIEALEKAKERYFDRAVVIARMQDILRAIPSAQPKQGRWVNDDGKPVKMINGIPQGTCWCSECGEWLTASDEYGVYGNFCPNCGARMTERSR